MPIRMATILSMIRRMIALFAMNFSTQLIFLVGRVLLVVQQREIFCFGRYCFFLWLGRSLEHSGRLLICNTHLPSKGSTSKASYQRRKRYQQPHTLSIVCALSYNTLRLTKNQSKAWRLRKKPNSLTIVQTALCCSTKTNVNEFFCKKIWSRRRNLGSGEKYLCRPREWPKRRGSGSWWAAFQRCCLSVDCRGQN